MDADHQLPEDAPATPRRTSGEEAPLPQHTRPLKEASALPSKPLPPPRSRLLILGAILFSLLMLALASVGLWLWWGQRTAEIGNLVAPPLTSLEELATEYPELAHLLLDPKLGSVYKDFLLAYEREGPQAALELARKRGLLNDDGDLMLTLELDTNDTAPLQAELEANGIRVTAVSGNLMDIVIPMETLTQLASGDSAGELLSRITNLQHIRRIRMPIISTPKRGRVETESLPKLNVPAWHQAGYTGKGIKVGVLDMEFDGYKELLGSDLPAQVTARSFVAGKEIDRLGGEHGTAVAEIIHDIAPDAELFLAAFRTDVEMRQATEWLVSQGVHIISNSTGSMYGPMDGTSEKARYVDSLVEQGILWVVSAGNEAQLHYLGEFTDQDGDGFHEFARGDETLGIESQGPTKIFLNWDDWREGRQDLDLYLLDDEDNQVASSTDIQNGPGSDAAEFIWYEFSPFGEVLHLAIKGHNLTRSVVINLFVSRGAIEYPVPATSINSVGDARNAFTVGAVNWEDDTLEEFSSRGPTMDGRLKPEIVGPDNVTSVAYGETWQGTSAAAPHVSGAAALVLEAFPEFSPFEVRDFLISRAIDLGPAGPDNDYGYGRLYLGDPPGLTGSVPTEVVVLPPQPTVLPPTATSPNSATATATPRIASPKGSSLVWFGFLACVVAPGLLGIGGLALSLTLWQRSRQQAAMGAFSPPDFTIEEWSPAPPPSPSLEPTPPQAPPVGATCPRCGSKLRPQAKFCPQCGLALSLEYKPRYKGSRCAYCGNPLRPTSRFCPRCGHPR